jgi:2'-5' RNA ligase
MRQVEVALKTPKTAVVVIPPEDIWEPIQAIRRKLDRNMRRWMPHITMIFPFRPMSEFEELKRKFEAICANYSPFQARLVEFRYFQHSKRSYTIWLAPDPCERIKELQGALSSVVPNCDDAGRHPHGFTPHLSVGQVRVNLEKTLLELREAWEPLEFTLDGISLINRNDPPDDVFGTWGKVPLGVQLKRETS